MRSKQLNHRQVWVLAGAVLLCAGSLGHAADAILNEYNAVRSDRWLDCDEPPADPTCMTDAADSFFGRVEGNGGNWFEIVVIADHLDMRGWELGWTQLGDPIPEAGTLFLSNDPLWADLRSGTIITFTEWSTLQGGLDTEDSYNPSAGDWWFNINSFDDQYVTTTTNVPGDGPGNFSVGNDDWQLTVSDGVGVVFGPAGEGIPLTGAGVSSREVFKLEEDPSDLVDPVNGNYEDGTSSTFGSANVWSGGANMQDFSALRGALEAVTLALVPRLTMTLGDTAAMLPPAVSEVAVGATIFVEVWATTAEDNGLASVSLDLTFDPAQGTADTIIHSDLFDQLTSGTIDNVAGTVDDLSGSYLPDLPPPPPCSEGIGRAPQWVRVATIEMTGDVAGVLPLQSLSSASDVFGVAICGVGDAAPDDVAHGFAEVLIGGECITAAQCPTDNCTWCECVSGACNCIAKATQADIGGGNGACPIDGTCDGNDRFHALNCFSNTSTTGLPGQEYPCEPDPPVAINVDAGGPQISCFRDGVCDGNDAFHALNCFENVDSEGNPPYPCGCMPTPEPPYDLVEPSPRLQTGMTLRAPAAVRPGDLVAVDVYFDDALKAVRGYQLHLGVSGGQRGMLELVDIAVFSERRDHVFAEAPATWSAFNLDVSQMVVGMDASEGVPTVADAYLATYTYRVSRDALGTFVVGVRYDDRSLDPADRTFLFSSHARPMDVSSVTPASITVGGPKVYSRPVRIGRR